MALSASQLTYLYHHLVFPPKLPQEDDRDAAQERSLVKFVTQTLEYLADYVGKPHTETVKSAITTIKNLGYSRDVHGNLSEAQIEALLTDLTKEKTGDAIPLEVKAQNAGILIIRSENHLNFEFFELSPTNEAAMRSSRLERTFPTSASHIPIDRMADKHLPKSIASTIAKMSTQRAPGFQPQARKNGKSEDEDRDTTAPGLVTDFLLNLTASLGETTNVGTITKFTREDVLWSDCKQPWRRSPTWLLVRVSLQLLSCRRATGSLHPGALYKAAMIFMFARLLESARLLRNEVGSEFIYNTCAKLQRRLRKFEISKQSDCLDKSWVRPIQKHIMSAYASIEKHWQGLLSSTQTRMDTTAMLTLLPANDLEMSLPALNEFLAVMRARGHNNSSSTFRPSSKFPDFPAAHLPDISTDPHEYTNFRLNAFEGWVEQHLHSWLKLHLLDHATCGKLRRSIEHYFDKARVVYKGVPVSLSVMYLTLTELWIACDRSACALYNQLRAYDPEICLTEFQCLVLPLRKHMERLNEIERYVRTRREKAVSDLPSLYRSFGERASFAVEYFDQSKELQATLTEIERNATAKRESKCHELETLKRKYDNLMRQHNGASCDSEEYVYNRRFGYKRSRHPSWCYRCSYKAQADALSIHIYEWPLSSDSAIAKATVFELKVPQAFCDWRDASVCMISTILGHRETTGRQPSCSYTLDRHQDISTMLSPLYPQRRIILLSEVKPYTVTHRKEKKTIPHLTEEDICLNNALRYAYYDAKLAVLPAAAPICTEDIPQTCMYHMPQRSQSIERFIYRPPKLYDGLGANEVIASLADCPAHMSIEEYKALSAIPLGVHVIYLNILTQLASSAVDFMKVETQCLIYQTIQQVGLPSADIERVNHLAASEEAFGRAVLEQLSIALRRVSENYESWRAVACFSLLARRISSLTKSSELHDQLLSYLAELRSVCFIWVCRLKERAVVSTDHEQRSELYSRATEIALLCTTTYDVESTDFDTVLQQKSAITMLAQSAIIIQENNRSVRSDDQGLYSVMLQSYRVLMYRLFRTIQRFILKDSTGLCDAVSANWAAFEPTTDWTPLDQSQEHWLMTTSGTLLVHFNLLTAELLVNGLPLSRLPSEFMQHELYRPLFSKSTLEVVPTDEPGLRFSAKYPYHNCKLHFGMRGLDMLVVAVGTNSRFDLIPSRVLHERLPAAFVSQYIHWYDHTSEEVVFRQRERPWSTDADVWRLKHDVVTKKWQLIRGSRTLVSMTSMTAITLSKMFLPLEDAQHVHVVLDSSTQLVDIQIPRLQLAFFIGKNDHSLHSRQFRGMTVDIDQNVGTLFGLTTKLVLKRGLSERMMLIPVPQAYNRTSIMYAKSSNTDHVTVEIDREEARKVYAYTIDEDLGRIIDNGDLESKLLIAYLHAITASCLPDPLLKMTGTEASLQILQSAAVRSFDLLSRQHVELLGQIASLSTRRVFYPSHEKVMQQVTWDGSLPSLSQHAYFRQSVCDIFDHANNMQVFFPGNEIFRLIADTRLQFNTNQDLDARDQLRTSVFRVPGFGAKPPILPQVELYNGRDRNENSERGRRAFVAATLMQRSDAALSSPMPNFKDLLLSTHFWQATVRGLDKHFSVSSLCYDSQWLGDASGNFKELWCSFHQVLTTASAERNGFDIMAWASTMAYATSADMGMIEAMIAIYKDQEFSSAHIPRAAKFNLADGHTFKFDEVETIVQRHIISFDDSEECHYPKQIWETDEQHIDRIRLLFISRKDAAVRSFVTALQRQWPVRRPTTPSSAGVSTYLRDSAAMADVAIKYEGWYDNREFLQYLADLSSLLARQAVTQVIIPQQIFTSPCARGKLGIRAEHASLQDIFAPVIPVLFRPPSCQTSSNPLIAPIEPIISNIEEALPMQGSDIHTRLENLCQRLETSARANTEYQYIKQLRLSCAALDVRAGGGLVKGKLPDDTRNLLHKYFQDCKNYFKSLNDALIQSVIDRSSFSNRVGLITDHSFRLNPRFWLSQLHHDRFHRMSDAWKRVIIEYGVAITNVHRATRLVSLINDPVDLYEELRHVGHSNWNPMHFPETLLLEAESGIMVRAEQELIAAHMRTPRDGDNIVLQLLMGRGKSSVIVPMLAAYLTDKEKLVRIIIAKAQSQQMLQMLAAKLGGILDRRIYHMPFSRNLRLSLADAKAIQQLFEECVKNRGVVLIQPEHILSFKLMAIESVLTDRVELARSLLSIQTYFEKVTRDVIDESDENYSTKFELIYTMGSQQSIDYAPERWLIIQQLLALVPRFAFEVHRHIPGVVEIQDIGYERYPRIRFLKKHAADQVFHLLAKHIVDEGIISGLRTRSQSDHMRVAILRYITKAELEKADIDAMEHSKFWTASTKLPLLLVRGLIAGGVLRFAFSTKRWRVNYGLDTTRDPEVLLAVPFRSKDTPSPRSEFSHPDVTIILTLLSNYYGGLTDEQLFDTLTHVLRSDQAAIHYDEFVRTASSSLPVAFRQLTGVSIRDRHQCIVQVFPALRYSKNVADYYLSHLVFPKQCKQFPQKLSASGWDLGAAKTHPTTGFSGTNDTLHLLPLDVKHLDLPSQSQTNAQVLAYLLQDETQVELLPPPGGSSSSDGEHLLNVISGLASEVRVILDCGASILELNNREVATAWLYMRRKDVQAVIYFDDEQLAVLDHTGRIESFQTSPHAKHMDSCIVYLDEAHTRGTDLKLPRHYRAAVTLGAHLTKDRLTQACMRLRKLGFGQAVTFMVPEEIATKIRDLASKPPEEAFTSTDVLCWAISETWQDLKRSMPLWAVQGHRFESHRHLLNGVNTTKEQAEAFLENEAQGVEARYKPQERDNHCSSHQRRDVTNTNISQIISRCREFEAMGFSSAALSEEQERELAPEIEEERQIERPPQLVAEKHVLHPDLLHLVETGCVINSLAFKPAFEALHSTSAAQLFDLKQLHSFPKDLLLTADFIRTVKPPAGCTTATFVSDLYSRPVQFVLSVPSPLEPDSISNLIVISPFEANQLLSRIRKAARVTLHLFAPRSNAGFASLDRLMLHNIGRAFSPITVSRSLTMQLNLFSGTLYLRSILECDELCDSLGLLRTSKPEVGQKVYPDGFLDPPAGKWGLRQSPVPFLRALLMKIRREGEGVEKTHLGRLLNGVKLEAAML